MALGANTIFDVRTTGSDTANGGAFDPGQTAGMFTDLTVTAGGDARIASPIVKSASYNFVAGDVGAWLYIASGTNWTPGWYQITAVGSNEATINAALGAYYPSVNKNPARLSTASAPWADAQGCATVQTPTAGTWTIDYSQQNAAQISYTDLASAGAGLTVSSAANPFAKQHVGNSLTVSSGTNFTAGTYIIASVAAGVATVVGAGNITSGVGSAGVGGLGGAFATPGKAASLKVAGNDIFWKSGTYNLSGNTVNTAGCQVSDTTGGVDQTNPTWWVGWNTNRSITNTDTTWPTLNANLQTALTLFSQSGSFTRCRNFTVDGNSKASLTGATFAGSYTKIDHIKAQNCTVIGIDVTGNNSVVSGWALAATGNSGTAAIRLGNSTSCTCLYSEAWANSTHGFVYGAGVNLIGCLSYSNTGSAKGFTSGTIGSNMFSCVAYGNASDGFDASVSIGCMLYMNCLAEANGASGWATGAVRGLVQLVNCAGYNNTSGTFTIGNLTDAINFIANTTGSFFTNAAAGDFSLNSTANQGALARAAGFPGVMPRGTSTGYLDIGAVQHQDSGGGGTVYIPIGGPSGRIEEIVEMFA